jgi:hypothetical protein
LNLGDVPNPGAANAHTRILTATAGTRASTCMTITAASKCSGVVTD